MLTNTLKKQRLEELVAHTSVLEKKMQHLYNLKCTFAFFSLSVKKDRLAVFIQI